MRWDLTVLLTMNSHSIASELTDKFFNDHELAEYRIYKENPDWLAKERQIYQQLMELEDGEFKQLTVKMWSIIFDDNNSGKMLDEIADVKKIAKQLYKLGGRQLMVSSSDYLPSLYQSEISRAWDGIGGWLH